MQTRPVALIVATATDWFGAARAPRALHGAGFDVAVLAPRDALVLASRFLAVSSLVPDAATPEQWMLAFSETVAATSPAIVLPGDDMSFRLLAALHDQRPAQLSGARHRVLADLIHASLGNPAFYRTSVDKTALPQ